MANRRDREGLKTARILMVLSSISPLFILWAIRGSKLIPDRYLVAFCAGMVVVPYAFLWLRIETARNLQERRELTVGTAEDHRDHLLVYLFAMLLPFYALDLGTWRDLAAMLAASRIHCLPLLASQPALHESSVRGTRLSRVHSLSASGRKSAKRQSKPGAHHATDCCATG